MDLPFFKEKSYDAGIPTQKLFIKNLAKTVKKTDLEYIFGRYFQTDEETSK